MLVLWASSFNVVDVLFGAEAFSCSSSFTPNFGVLLVVTTGRSRVFVVVAVDDEEEEKEEDNEAAEVEGVRFWSASDLLFGGNVLLLLLLTLTGPETPGL